MNKDPYTVLNVSRTATAEDVKRAFHKLAHQHHPDKGGDGEKFKECSAAYAEINRYIKSGYHVPETTYPKGAEDPIDFEVEIKWDGATVYAERTQDQSKADILQAMIRQMMNRRAHVTKEDIKRMFEEKMR